MAVHCYLDQATLSSLKPTTPSLLSWPPGSLGPKHGVLIMGSSGNSNPHYLLHYSLLHNGDLFPGFDSFSTLKAHTHSFGCTHTTKMHLMLPSGSLLIPFHHFSLVEGSGDQVSVAFCLFFCMAEQRQSVSTSLLVCFAIFFSSSKLTPTFLSMLLH